ncbi:MAG: endonuclease/exonuclease/phosphatase family protein [Candidatus Saccharimonadales bacterium]
MRCASFNVLADAYIGYGDYSHVDPSLLLPNARTAGIVQLIDGLGADVVGLQEVEVPLLSALDQADNWQIFWSPKGHDEPDGCLTLVKHNIEVGVFNSYSYSDDSGHVMQTIRIGRVVFANTHLKWAPADSLEHIGVNQAAEMLERIGPNASAVIFADCNDKPNGPVRRLIENAGFMNVNGSEPTAIVNQELVALDLLAVRGISTRCISGNYNLAGIPNKDCPSDHMPILGDIDIDLT